MRKWCILYVPVLYSKFEICISHMTPCSIDRKMRRWVSYILTKLDTIFSFLPSFPLRGLFLVLQIHGRACVHLTLLEISMVRDPLTWDETRRKLVSAWRWKGHMQKNPWRKKSSKNPPFWNEIFMASNCSINPNIAALLRESHQTWSDICTVGSSQNGENLLIVECLQGGAHRFCMATTLSETHSKSIPHGNGWLEDHPFLLGNRIFRGRTVSFREGNNWWWCYFLASQAGGEKERFNPGIPKRQNTEKTTPPEWLEFPRLQCFLFTSDSLSYVCLLQPIHWEKQI